MNQQTRSAISDLIFTELHTLQTSPERLTDINSWHGHIPFAFWLTKILAPTSLVELGVHKGDSYSAFCQAVQAYSLNTACYGVDTWQGEEHAGHYEEAIYQEFSAYHDKRYSKFSRLLRSTFDQALRYFSDGSIDLLHIDGRHGYDDVKHDFESWLPKLSNKAVVLFHDINVREREFGVWKFFLEISEKYAGHTFSFLHSHGLGVLVIGDQAPDVLQQLCHLDESDITYLRLAFSTFGEFIKSQSQISDLKIKLSVLEEKNKQLTTERDNVTQSILVERRRKDVESNKAEFQLACLIREKDRQLQEKDNQLQEKDSQLQEKSHEFVAMRNAKDCEISTLRNLKDQEINVLMTSRSMRLTKPVRGLANLARKFR